MPHAWTSKVLLLLLLLLLPKLGFGIEAHMSNIATADFTAAVCHDRVNSPNHLC